MAAIASAIAFAGLLGYEAALIYKFGIEYPHHEILGTVMFVVFIALCLSTIVTLIRGS